MAVLSDTIMNNLRVTHELFLGNPISVRNGGTGTDISDLLDDTLLQYSSSSQKVLSVTSNYLYVSDSLYTDYATKAVKLGGAYFSNESSYSSNFTLLGFGKPVSGSDQIYLYPLDQSKCRAYSAKVWDNWELNIGKKIPSVNQITIKI